MVIGLPITMGPSFSVVAMAPTGRKGMCTQHCCSEGRYVSHSSAQNLQHNYPVFKLHEDYGEASILFHQGTEG